MPTINQLIKKPRRSLPRINKVKDLEACPQKARGFACVVKTMTAEEAELGSCERLRACG